MCQSVYRQICDLGFKHQYNTDNNFSLLVRMFCSMAFVPNEEMINAFDYLCEDEAVSMDFISYFELTYIGATHGQSRIRKAPLYPIVFWNIRSRVLDKFARTNNTLEEFHSTLRHSAASKNPNIWKFIDVLTKEEALTQTKKFHLQMGEMPNKKRKYEKLDTSIETLIEKYDGSNQTEFLRAIAFSLIFFRRYMMNNK